MTSDPGKRGMEDPAEADSIPHFYGHEPRRINEAIQFSASEKHPVGDWGISATAITEAPINDDLTAQNNAEFFLRSLSAGLPAHWLREVRAIRREPKQVTQRWFGLDQIGQVAQFCLNASLREFDVYVGVQPRAETRGGATSIAAITTLYADLDCGTSKPLHDKADAVVRLNRLAGLGLGPSIVVDSGNGLHAYWLLREPLNDDGRLAWRDCMVALAQRLDADPSVVDLPRILRVPGTTNWKRGDEPRLVRLIHCDPERRFSLLDFDDLLPCRQSAATADADEAPATAPMQRGVRDRSDNRVRAAINATGWHVQEKHDSAGNLVAFVIQSPCPACPGWPTQQEPPRSGTAHVAPLSGALRCKRAQCRAGAAATGIGRNAEPIGIPFNSWTLHFAASLPTMRAVATPVRQIAPFRLKRLRQPPR